MRTLPLRYARLDLHSWGCVTRFHDGTEAHATPHETPHYHEISARCGFPGDVLGYCHSHEFMHLFCEEWFHDRPSRVLWAIAHGAMLTGPKSIYEELVAQTAQRWVWAGERPIAGGADWDGFKAAALELWNG